MIKEKIYGEIVQIIREMYDIQTSEIKDVKKILIKKGHTVDYSGTISPYSSSYQLLHSRGDEHKIQIPFLSKERENMHLGHLKEKAGYMITFLEKQKIRKIV